MRKYKEIMKIKDEFDLARVIHDILMEDYIIWNTFNLVSSKGKEIYLDKDDVEYVITINKNVVSKV